VGGKRKGKRRGGRKSQRHHPLAKGHFRCRGRGEGASRVARTIGGGEKRERPLQPRLKKSGLTGDDVNIKSGPLRERGGDALCASGNKSASPREESINVNRKEGEQCCTPRDDHLSRSMRLRSGFPPKGEGLGKVTTSCLRKIRSRRNDLFSV